MRRLTVTLSEARCKALKEAAVQRSKTIGQLIDESLGFCGIESREDARDLALVTGHERLLADEGMHGRVMSARASVDGR